jgi:hypothetical protein
VRISLPVDVTGRAGKVVGLGLHEHTGFHEVIQGGLALRLPVIHRGHLLLADLRASGRREVAELGVQSSHLLDRGGPRVSDHIFRHPGPH